MLSLAICWLNIRPHLICNLVWKGAKCEKICVYIKTTKCNWLFKRLCVLFFKKTIELKHCLPSIKPSTWTVSISITFKYLGKTWDNHCDTWITHHIHVGGIDNDKVNLVKCKDHDFCHGLSCIFFMFNLNMPCWTS